MADITKVAEAVTTLANEYGVPSVAVLNQLTYLVGEDIQTIQKKIVNNILKDVEKAAEKVRKPRKTSAKAKD